MIDHQELLNQIGNADKIWHLGQASLVRGLPNEDLQRITQMLEDQIFCRGEVIFDQGEPANCLFFLNRGSVRLSVPHNGCREKTIEILRRGDIFGLEAIGSDGQFGVRAVAHEETWVSILTRDQFVTIAHEQPTLFVNLIQILLRRLANAQDDIKALCFMDIQQRLVQTLLKLAHDHGQKLINQEEIVKLKLRLSHDYLAGLIGSNRPYLSNIMSNFKKQGWISYRRNHLLINVPALEAFEATLDS